MDAAYTEAMGSVHDKYLRVAAVAGLVFLASCGDEAAFGMGGARNEGEPAPDFSGTDQPADLTTPELAARTGIGLVRSVEATALALGEIGDAVGDLFPEEDNPCPDGGSASSDLGGSVSRPELTMYFDQCVRGDSTLHGTAEIRCDDFDGDSCDGGRATLGEGDTDFLFLHVPANVAAFQVRLAGTADLALDQGDNQVSAVSRLRGEIRYADTEARYAFIAEGLEINLREASETQTEIRLSGVSALGGASSQNCATGRFDTETLDTPLLYEDGRVIAGRLRFHSPPPRPGAQQAVVNFLPHEIQAQGSDGSQQIFTEGEFSAFCR